MNDLSELDASFLLLESERAPMHVGGVYIFQRAMRSKFDFQLFRAAIESKLHLAPFFRQRLIEPHLTAQTPRWADDPEFNLDRHLYYDSVQPGERLLQKASEIFSECLERDRPLWQVHYVDELENEPNIPFKHNPKRHFALVIKIHISAIDALDGQDILSLLLTISPQKLSGEPLPSWSPSPLPESESWLSSAYSSALNLPGKLKDMAKDTASSAFYNVIFDRLQKLNLPASLMSVAAAPMNRNIDSRRYVNCTQIDLSAIREIRSLIGEVNINDVVMGICAEALYNYLKDHEDKSKAPLIALSPISVRSTRLDVKSGRQLNALLFSLATNEPDPIRRIHRIHAGALEAEHYNDAISAARLTEVGPSTTAALSSRVYCEFLLAQKHKPMFNLPIINIPGPQFPLYFETNELTHYYGSSPLFDGIGIALIIVSYQGTLSFTVTSDLPDSLERPLVEYIDEALHTIRAAASSDSQSIESESEVPSSMGIIEDALDFAGSLFTFASKSTKD